MVRTISISTFIRLNSAMKLLYLSKAMFHLIKTVIVAGSVWGLIAVIPAAADKRHLLLQSTTSTLNSGLYDVLLPAFTKKSGIEVRVVAVGTGQALRLSLIHI